MKSLQITAHIFNCQVPVYFLTNVTVCSTTNETECTPVSGIVVTTVDNPKQNCVEKPIETCEVVEKLIEPYISKLVPYKECKQLDCDS